MAYNVIMDMLILSQTIFYLTISVVVILFGILLCVITWHMIAIAKHLHRLSNNIESTAKEVQDTINNIIDVLAGLPIMSFLFKKSHSRVKRK